MLTLLVVLKSVSSTQERCPYCHEELGPCREACARCKTPHHPECLAELGRCTVLGCSHLRRRRHGTLRPRPPQSSWVRPLKLFGVLAFVFLGLYVLIPNLYPTRRHHRTNDYAAIWALRAIANAQTIYREGDKDGDNILDYAPNLENLTNTGSSGQEDLIDEVLAAGTKRGYVFAITSSSEFRWTANANPLVPGTTGNRYYGINMAGHVYFHPERPVRFEPDGSSKDTFWR